MQEKSFVSEEYYHIYNRGVEKRDIFLDDNDRWRFLTTIFLYQWRNFIPQIGRFILFVRPSMSDKSILEKQIFKRIFTTRLVELACFCLMPNHFHLILKQADEGGISFFMQRVGDSYTKYFNTKYQRTGHLFGGAFQAVHIDNDEYLAYLSAYIHLNPREFQQWRGKETKYPWSSLQDFLEKNRWEPFLSPSLILEQFVDKNEYKKFLEEGDFIKNTLEDRYMIDYE